MLEYSTGNFRAGIGWQAAAKQDRHAAGDKSDNRIPNGGTPGWSVFNIDMSYSVKFLRFDLSLLNLLNKDYRYHGSGINGYGRSAFLTASLKL
ncbi:MAG: TonB-dependent receptor [Bacteroidales bacterium]|nr:TonB-dependent receptor [Bacteroidales bacterium]